jgi:hypothetical protein
MGHCKSSHFGWVFFACKFVYPKLLKGTGWNFSHLLYVIILRDGHRSHNIELTSFRVITLLLLSSTEINRTRWHTESSCLSVKIKWTIAGKFNVITLVSFIIFSYFNHIPVVLLNLTKLPKYFLWSEPESYAPDDI